MGRIIAVLGMCGAGKSVVCDYLEDLGFKTIYFGGVTMDKLKEENLEVTPENEKMMRERLRKEYGMAAYAILLLPKIKELSKTEDVVIDGLYSWDELKVLKNEFDLTTIAVVVDKELRYERLSKRKNRPFSKEDAIKRDISEIENLAKAGPIAYADYYIFNIKTKEKMKKRLEEILINI